MTLASRVVANYASRIAVLSMHTSPLAPLGGATTGGMNVYVHEVSERLATRGRLVDVFTRRENTVAPTITEFAPGARLIQIDAGPAESLVKTELIQFTDDFADGVEAFRAAESIEYDIVHSHYWLSAVAGERIVADWRVPHVAMFHTLGEVKLRARASEQEPPERLEAERRLVHSVDRVIAATDYEQRVLKQVYQVSPSRVSVIPLGVDPERFHPDDRAAARAALDLPADEQIVLAVGRIEPLKGLDILIRAAAQVTDRSRLRLLIVGGDEQARPEFDRLAAIAEEVGVEALVTFVGAVAHEELPDYYRAADVVVMPSFAESFGLVAVEAMASGVPVVVSRVGGLASTVADGRTGYLVPWRCPEPFAEKIELLLLNEPLRDALGAAGVERMRAFSWGSVADRLVTLYDEVARPSVLDGTSVAGG